jgi:hypothetical protein
VRWRRLCWHWHRGRLTWSAAAKNLLAVPAEGVDEGPEGVVAGADEALAGAGEKVAGQVGGGGQLGGGFDLIAVAEGDQPLVEGPMA